MAEVKNKVNENGMIRILIPVLGLAAVSLPALLYCILGKESWAEVQDQLDGELLTYIMRAKYLFQGDTIPEFMSGMGKTSLTPPAPLAVLLFRILEPFPAYVVLLWTNLVAGFLGMYFFLRQMEIRRIFALICGILYCYMPFYPVYGLSQLGIPLLLLGYIRLLNRKGSLMGNLLCILWYGALSSLALVGYVWVCLGFLITVLELIFRRGSGRGIRSLVASILLTLEYLLLNGSLLAEMGSGFVSHRTEIRAQAGDFVSSFWSLLLEGGSYSKVYSGAILFSAGFILALYRLLRESGAEEGKLLRRQWEILGVILFFTLLAAFYESGAGLALRNALGGPFVYFQADRVYWTFPFAWMVILALSLEILIRIRSSAGEGWKAKLGRVLALGVAVFLTLFQGALIFRDSSVNRNLRLLLIPSYENITWESFFMEDVFAQIRESIPEEEGTYQTVSLGLYPSIALYNGFSCVDGYSNNYDLHYKYRFAAVMAEELAENPEASAYFYGWGNRCYLVSSTYGFYEMGSKTAGMTYSDLSYNLAAMKDLNIRYLFANAPIEDYSDMGLTLLDGSPFSSDTSYYEVYVYRVK